MAQGSTLFEAAAEYWRDAAQRGVLFMETLNERGNTYVAQSAKTAPHVLNFPVEILRDGRTLERPANYALVRIVPPNDVTIDPMKPPIVVVDPRAGHGPGIGGMKPESEIGVALRAGHPVYFIGFLPKPEPGQTIEDVCRAEGTFIEDVAQRHAEAEGKPIVIANCQAGWQTMMMAAIRPDLTGPIILAGSPLSYWAGVRGKNPMRYLGGLLGGTWLTELSGDLGAGIFDGAHLVANFESLNPANTYWTKPYNVYSKVDTERERFLDFETWRGNPVLLNAGEMQWIADNLFVGNKLSSGQIRTSGASASICATSNRQSSCSAPGVMTSLRPSRRSTGFSTSTTTSTRSSPGDKRSSIRCIPLSATSVFSYRARWRRKSTTSSSPAWR